MRFYTGGAFLVCSAGKQGSGCSPARWPYDHFEKSFLRFVEQLDLASVVRVDAFDKTAIDDAIQALEIARKSKEQEMDSFLQLLKINPGLTYVAQKLDPLQQQLNEINGQLAQKKFESDDLQTAESEFNRSKVEIGLLISRLQKAGHGDLYKLRSQLSARIKRLIRKLRVAPAGSAPIRDSLIKEVLMDPDPDITRAEKRRIIARIRAWQHQLYFDVEFRSGNGLRLFPDRNDPTRFWVKHEISESLPS